MSVAVWPGGYAADVWTFVTYAFIHGDLNHLFFNAIWLLAFCSPVARRFGTWRLLAFFAVTAAAGAAAHLATHFGEVLPMVGVSAVISGAMAASMRFAFQPGGPIGLWGGRDEAYRCRRCRSPWRCAIGACSPSLVWFGINALLAGTAWGVMDRARSPGRRISAASWPACSLSPGSIRCRALPPTPAKGRPPSQRFVDRPPVRGFAAAGI